MPQDRRPSIALARQMSGGRTTLKYLIGFGFEDTNQSRGELHWMRLPDGWTTQATTIKGKYGETKQVFFRNKAKELCFIQYGDERDLKSSMSIRPIKFPDPNPR